MSTFDERKCGGDGDGTGEQGGQGGGHHARALSKPHSSKEPHPLTMKEQLAAEEAKEKLGRMVKVGFALTVR